MLLKLWVDIVVVFKIILATRNYVRMNMSNCLSRFRAVLNRNRRRVSFQGSSAKCFLSQLRFAGSWPRHVISPFLCENLWKNSLYFKTRAHQKLILQLFQPFEQPEKDLILLLASDLRKAAQPGLEIQEHVQGEQASDWQTRNFWTSRRKCNWTELWYFLRTVLPLCWKKHSEAIFVEQKRVYYCNFPKISSVFEENCIFLHVN